MYNLAVILFLVSLFNDQKVVPLNTELSLNGTSCPSNVTLRELKLGIIVAVARLSEGLSVTITCADIPFPVTFMERRVIPFLSVSIFNPVGFPSTVIPPTPLGPPPDWNGEICTVAFPSCKAMKLVVEFTYPCSPCFNVSSLLSSTNSFLCKAFSAFKWATESIRCRSCLAVKRAVSTESFHCCNSLFFPSWAFACIAPVRKRRSKILLKHFTAIYYQIFNCLRQQKSSFRTISSCLRMSKPFVCKSL